MRDCNKRICIVVGKEQHQKWKEFANHVTQGSVSQLVRWAIEQAIRAEEKEQTQGDIEANPMEFVFGEIKKGFDKLGKKIDGLPQRISHKSGDNSQREIIKRSVWNFLESTGKTMTIPEICDALPHNSTEIKTALENLEDEYVVERIEPEQILQEGGVPGWRAL